MVESLAPSSLPTMSLPQPPYNDDKSSFAYITVHKRWPTIIEGAIDDLNAAIKLDSSLQSSGEVILKSLNGLLDDFKQDKVVRKFTDEEIELDSTLEHFNSHYDEFSKTKTVTWLTGPWLYLECYLYKIINLFFIKSGHSFWLKFDIFEALKNKTFQQSEFGVVELCKRFKLLDSQLTSASKEELKLLFKEFIDVSLWGNATDLSLLAGNVTLEDIKSVQGAEVRKKNEEKIIVNDTDLVWDYLESEKTKDSIDIVLDNSGFELFADLIFALFLLDGNLIKKVNLHCKKIPWFVSDTMPKDFDLLLNQLVDPQFYPDLNADDANAIKYVHDKILNYHKSNQINAKTHDFWTLSYNYWDIPKFDDLYEELLTSKLLIFKGDLNYRKLTGDLKWEYTTPFKKAIQQLSTSKLPILSLRTCKADVVVGLPEGVNEKLVKTYHDEGNENGQFWTSSGKWAVISFNK